MILNPVIPELELSYISPDEAPDNDSAPTYRPLQVNGSQDTSRNRSGYISNRPLSPKTPHLRVPPSSKSVSIRVHPWFSPTSSTQLFHFSLITSHSALPPTLTRTYDWGIRYRDDLIRRVNHLDGEEIHYALHDYYNVTAITDSAGEVLERYGYSAFGDVRFMTAAYVTKPTSDHAWDLLYKAQFRDIETGFYNYGYRYLTPMLGRWLSRDPIGERGGLNLYGFVINNGLNGTDLYGLDVWAFSGIRFSFTQENRNYVRDILNRSSNDEIESSNVSGEPHSTMKDHPSASDKALIFGLLLFAKTQLDSEARRKAEKAVSPGQFCKSCSRKKTSITLFMVAPKRIPQNLPETECCNISYIIYFDSADLVPQGGIFSSWKDHWTGKNVSAWNVNLGGAANHDFSNQLKFKETQENGEFAGQTHNLHEKVQDFSTKKDKVFVCHSQGCNIAIETIIRACNNQ